MSSLINNGVRKNSNTIYILSASSCNCKAQRIRTIDDYKVLCSRSKVIIHRYFNGVAGSLNSLNCRLCNLCLVKYVVASIIRNLLRILEETSCFYISIKCKLVCVRSNNLDSGRSGICYCNLDSLILCCSGICCALESLSCECKLASLKELNRPYSSLLAGLDLNVVSLVNCEISLIGINTCTRECNLNCLTNLEAVAVSDTGYCNVSCVLLNLNLEILLEDLCLGCIKNCNSDCCSTNTIIMLESFSGLFTN